MPAPGSYGVLFVVDDMNAGGMERQVVELLRGIRRSGRITARLVVLKPGGQRLDEAREASSESIVLGFAKRFASLSLASRISRFAMATGSGAVCCFGLISGFFGLLAGRMAGIPVLNASIRSAPLVLTRKDRLSRFLMRRADLVIANSNAGRKAFGFERSKRCIVIPNGLDLARFENIAPRQGAGWDVCMVGNFWAKKDHATMLEAFGVVRKELPSASMVLVGKDWGTLDRSRQLASERGISRAVDIITTSLDPSGVIASSRVCVLLSPDGEGISNAILEYMALARPVVATSCEGNAESVDDGRTGILVPNDSRAVANAILTLLGDPALASRMGTEGKRRAFREFSIGKMVKSFESAFMELEAKGRP